MSLYRTSVNHPVTTTLVFLALAFLGVFSLSRTSIDLMPEFDSTTVMVFTAYPGASAADIETNLTKVLENSVNGVEDLKSLTSQSKENISLLIVEFNAGVDIDDATNNIRDKLDMVKSQLPDGVQNPVLFKFSADDMPILILSATASESVNGLDKILDDKLSTPLARVNGVGTVSVSGAPTREIKIYCDPMKLQAYGLSLTGIANVIAYENRNIPSGNIDIGSETYTLRVQKEFDDPSELLDVIVGSSEGRAIYLKDVATLSDGEQEREQVSLTNGQRSARIIIQKQSGSNTVNVINDVKASLKKIEKTLPSDIKIVTVSDSSTQIINTINTLIETIIITFIVVALVVFVFLGEWKTTLIIILSIPLALLASLIYLYASGNTLNIISMSALAIAIGMVVDDAIVVLENVSTHLARGEKPAEAAVHGTGEVGISVIASTLTMLCVFLPLTMVQGTTGIMFRQLGWIVSFIMTVSTTAALTFVPMLCAYWLKPNQKHGKLYMAVFTPINRTIDWISRGYAHAIHWSVKRGWIVVGVFVAVLALSLVLLFPSIKTEYFPHQDQDRISATIELPMGTAQEITAEVADRIDAQVLEAVPEIKAMNTTYGQADTDNAFASIMANGTHVISLTLNIGTSSTRNRTSATIAEVIRGVLAQYPEIRRATVTEGMGMMGASSVELEIYGYSFEDTDRMAREVQAKMQENPIFSQVTLSRDEYTPELQMDFDRTKLALNGLNSTTAGMMFSAAMSGTVASKYREDGEEYDIRVRYAPEFRTTRDDLENITITNNQGKQVKFGDLGSVKETLVPPTIERKDRERVITVKGILGEGEALSDAVAVSEDIIAHTDFPNGITTEIAGDYEDQKDMFADLFMLMIIMVVLVYMVMASQFESYMGPLVIMFSIPFALIGVFFGLWLTGTALGMMAMIGCIILIGIVVKNGIVLIDYTILCRERGMNTRDASTTAARSRLRPILMTTLTTVLGMLPMAVGTGEGSEMWKSLGITVCWGLTISTLVTLILIPTVYSMVVTAQERRKKRI